MRTPGGPTCWRTGNRRRYAGYFDIDWHPPTAKAAFLQDNRVLLPMLGDLYGNVLAKGELSLKIEDTGIHVRYYETRLPLDPKSYARNSRAAAASSPELAEILRDIRAPAGARRDGGRSRDGAPPRKRADQGTPVAARIRRTRS